MEYYLPRWIVRGNDVVTYEVPLTHNDCASTGAECRRCILFFLTENNAKRCAKMEESMPDIVLDRLVEHGLLTKAKALELTLDNSIRKPCLN